MPTQTARQNVIDSWLLDLFSSNLALNYSEIGRIRCEIARMNTHIMQYTGQSLASRTASSVPCVHDASLALA